jgi:hypothetical protein
MVGVMVASRRRILRQADQATTQPWRVPIARRPLAGIKRFLAETNDNPKPFIWTADPDKVIAAVKRECQC